MRDIKFRAWINLKKNDHDFMVYQGQPDLETLQSFMFHWGDSKNLMQYTGIKDKNGKEIYEGDILEMNDRKASRSQVKYDDKKWARFLAYDREAVSVYMPFVENAVNQWVVIGNIYENPELI